MKIIKKIIETIKKNIKKISIIRINFEKKYGKVELSNITSRAAEVAFFMLLSLFPFLLFTISAIVFIPHIYLNKYITILSTIIPSSAFVVLEGLIRSIIKNRSIELLITSFFLATWSMSKAVKSLIRGVNRSYGVNETRSFFRVLFMSVIFIVMLLFMIIVSIFLLICGERIGRLVFDLIRLDKYFIYIWNICRYIVGISVIVIILVTLYTVMPNTNMKAKDSVYGAVVATLLWILVSYVYSFYVNNFATYDVIYGSLGGIIVLMTWIYLSSWTILIGSEVNARLMYKKRKITKIKEKNKK